MLRRSSQVKPLRRGARDRDVPAPVEGFLCDYGPWLQSGRRHSQPAYVNLAAQNKVKHPCFHSDSDGLVDAGWKPPLRWGYAKRSLHFLCGSGISVH
jgi:hypothetical protein